MASVRKVLFKADHDSSAVWLNCYVYILAILTYLTTVNQRLTIFFFPKITYVSWERFSLDEVKKSIKPLKK